MHYKTHNMLLWCSGVVLGLSSLIRKAEIIAGPAGILGFILLEALAVFGILLCLIRLTSSYKDGKLWPWVGITGVISVAVLICLIGYALLIFLGYPPLF